VLGKPASCGVCPTSADPVPGHPRSLIGTTTGGGRHPDLNDPESEQQVRITMHDIPVPLIEFVLFLALVLWLVWSQRRRSDPAASEQTTTHRSMPGTDDD